MNINLNEDGKSTHEVDNLYSNYGTHASGTHSLTSECQHSHAWHTCATEAMLREMSRALLMQGLVLKACVAIVGQLPLSSAGVRLGVRCRFAAHAQENQMPTAQKRHGAE